MSNAIKYTKVGYVKIKADSIIEDEALIKVIDTGVGIDAEKLKALFSLFLKI